MHDLERVWPGQEAGTGAIMAEPKDLITREIDEELRRERLAQLWDKYGTYVLGAAVVFVFGVIAYQYYDSRRTAANEAASVQYIVALRDFAINKPADAQKALEDLAITAPSGYATLVRLRLAAYEQSQGNAAEAAAAFEEVAKDSNVDPILADYARLQAAMLKLDTASFTDVKNRLTPLAGDRSPWRHSARESLGMAAYKAGRTAEARNYFQRLVADRVTPPGIVGRARIMLALLTEAKQAATAPPVAEKADVPAKSEPTKDAKSKAKPADKKIN
jgi:hypothetical protein